MVREKMRIIRILCTVALGALFGLSWAGPAEGQPPGVPEVDIMVTDSALPDDDLWVPFGEVTEGDTGIPPQTVIINSVGTLPLDIGSITMPALPFAVSDQCSGLSLAPGSGCTITISLSPSATGDFWSSFDIYSNDLDDNENPVTVYISGRVLSANNGRPTPPELVLPANGQTVDGSNVTFEWNRSADPDGDVVAYDLFVCTDTNFIGCETPENGNGTPIFAALEGKGVYYAGTGAGILFIGMVMAGSARRRRKMALLAAVIILAAGMLLSSCGGGGGGGGTTTSSQIPGGEVAFNLSGLWNGTTYYWKVVSEDTSGNRTDSEIRSITTLP